MINHNIFELKKLIQAKDYETILDLGDEFYKKTDYHTAKMFLIEGLKDTKVFKSNYDDKTGELTFLDVGYYFVILGKIYLHEGNKFRAGESFVKAVEKIMDRYPITEFDNAIEEYELEELLEQTGYKHKAYTGWFGSDYI